MRILFVSSYAQSNSGSKALLRLAEAVKAKGHEVKILTTSLGLDNEIIECIRLPRGIDLLNRILNTLIPNYFSLVHFQLIRRIEKYNPDAINIHWTHGFTIPISIIPQISKKYKVAWTMHDMWAITNNSFYDYKKEESIIKPQRSSFQNLLLKLKFSPKILFSYKKNILSKLKLAIISPSKWLLEKTKISPVFENSKHFNIPNGVDLNIFKPLDQNILKGKYKIEKDRKVILFLTANLTDDRKGAKYFIEAMKNIEVKNAELSKKITIITVGKSSEQLKDLIPQECMTLDATSSDEKIVEFYNLADIFVSTSIADNFPSTSLESLACATPIVAFNVGGISEIVDDEKTGFLSELKNVKDLSVKITTLLTNEELLSRFSTNARLRAVENFDINKQAEKYLEVLSS